MSVTNSSVTMTYKRPADASPTKVVIYVIKYRKAGSNYPWKWWRESTGLWQSVTGLEANTVYEFRVVARYEGESSTMESRSAVVKTTIHKTSKCTVRSIDLSLLCKSSQVKLPLGVANNWQS